MGVYMDLPGYTIKVKQKKWNEISDMSQNKQVISK